MTLKERRKMNRPDNIKVYPELDLKLGIKSSLPEVKPTLALVIMFWCSANKPSVINYSKQVGDKIEIDDDIAHTLIEKYHPVYSKVAISDEEFISQVNANQLFSQQIEGLIVALELIWQIAKIKFTNGMAFNQERTGGKRYAKFLQFTTNLDIINALLFNSEEQFSRVFLNWLGFNTIEYLPDYEKELLRLLTCLSESAVYKVSDGQDNVIFYMSGVYSKLLTTEDAVNIEDDKEAKGSLRILKSSLREGINPYLTYQQQEGVSILDGEKADLKDYLERIDTYLSLTKAAPITSTRGVNEKTEESVAAGGVNVLLYGVPGCGKSRTINDEYCNDESRMERLVFHPDYTYSDFIGQILPSVSGGNVSYEFTSGPFTRILKKAINNSEREFFLIIEEINRGNASAIFGDVFQLLDRNDTGESEYGITNADIALAVYGDPSLKVRIPSNLSIISTMNTSDQNVFTLDTAFQRRWTMRMIENNLDKVPYADVNILDSGVTWRTFTNVMNSIILERVVLIASSEDKRLGAFFVCEDDLKFDHNEINDTSSPKEKQNARMQNRRFPEKMLKYLWDDAFKFSREDIFKTDQFKSLEQVIKGFCDLKEDDRFTVFTDNVYYRLVPDKV